MLLNSYIPALIQEMKSNHFSNHQKFWSSGGAWSHSTQLKKKKKENVTNSCCLIWFKYLVSNVFVLFFSTQGGEIMVEVRCIISIDLHSQALPQGS